jgi:hypothetical protein
LCQLRLRQPEAEADEAEAEADEAEAKRQRLEMLRHLSCIICFLGDAD